nr:XdhC/CoxI family protein [uncultured Holophaga sp.]
MWLKSLEQWRSQGHNCALVTIIEALGSTPRKAGSNMAVRQDGVIAGSVGGGAVERICIELAREAMASETCITRRFESKGDGEDWLPSEGDKALGVCGGAVTLFIEPIVVDPEVVIFGGGHVGQSLAKYCELLELPYRVFDDRPDFVGAERFPGARDRICGPYTDIAQVALSSRSYCVIMTQGHEHDEEVLEQLLPNPVIPYIGMIGSPRKASVLIHNIQQRGGVIDERVYCPIGLGLGSNLPREIGLSIVSELVLLMRGGRAGHRRLDWNGETTKS